MRCQKIPDYCLQTVPVHSYGMEQKQVSPVEVPAQTTDLWEKLVVLYH